MEFIPAVKKCLLTDCFKISGRAPRSEYWWFYLFAIIAGFVLGLFNIIPVIGQLIYIVGMLWIVIANLTVAIRRLHDIGRTGLWILAPVACIILAVLLIIVGMASQSQGLATVGFVFCFLAFVSYIVLFIFTLLPGTQGENKYGANPLA